MKLTKESRDSLKELWYNKDFQVLVGLLHTRIDNLGKLVLLTRDQAVINDMQKEAEVITRLIRSIKDASKSKKASSKE